MKTVKIGPFWALLAWNMWWFGVVSSWNKKPTIFEFSIGRVINDISRVRRGY